MNRKLGWTVAALVVSVLALSGVADRLSDRYAADALERAFFTWAIARGLNGVISVAQGTEVALEPGGVGVNLTVGQILDPVNDLIEQFSSIMLAATSAIALQNLLLKITGSDGVTVFLLLTAAIALTALWVPAMQRRPRLVAFCLRFFLISVTLRFALPFLMLGSNVVFDYFLQETQVESTAALQVTSEEIAEISEQKQEAADPERGLFQRFSDMVGESIDNLNVRQRLADLQERASGASRHVVNLIVIFVLQTILLPIGFLWLLLQAMKALATRAVH